MIPSTELSASNSPADPRLNGDPPAARPVSARQFAGLMKELKNAQDAMAVAVSGGADSLALCLLAAEWADTHGITLTALTVDHGLRPEATRETREVRRWLAERDIRCEVLRGSPTPGDTAVQERARELRYNLIASWCRRNGVGTVLLGHTLDDQIETYLMRRAKDSGPMGLAGMAKQTRKFGLVLVRPLLHIPHVRLRATLKDLGQPFVEDPSNTDNRFARVRIREELQQVSDKEALYAEIEKDMANRAAVREKVERKIRSALKKSARVSPYGFVTLETESLGDEEVNGFDIRALSFAHVLRYVGGTDYLPPLEKARRLLQSGEGTLSGCRLKSDDGLLFIVREARNLPRDPVPLAGQDLLWDGRFLISSDTVFRSGEIAPLGAKGLRLVKDAMGDVALAPVRRDAAMTLPALWDSRGLAAVPSLGFVREGRFEAMVRAVFEPANPLAPSNVYN